MVAVFPSPDGEGPADVSNRLFEAWRLGDAERSNGVLLAVFLEERKARIEVGYGLEGRPTDAFSRRIVDKKIALRFRPGDYFGGSEAACDVVNRATSASIRERRDAEIPFARGGALF